MCRPRSRFLFAGGTAAKTSQHYTLVSKQKPLRVAEMQHAAGALHGIARHPPRVLVRILHD